VIRKYTAVFFFVSAALLFSVLACSKGTDKETPPASAQAEGAAIPTERSISTRLEGKEPPIQTQGRKPSVPEVRALPVDKLIGGRPLDRIVPEDYTLGPLQDLSNTASGDIYSAACAVREFLDGLREGRLSAAAPEARDILEFMLAELFSGKIRVIRWRMGAGTPRPEGGYTFPVLMDTGTGQTQGEVFVERTPKSAWRVELAIVDLEEIRLPRAKSQGAFDPTIRAVRRTGR